MHSKPNRFSASLAAWLCLAAVSVQAANSPSIARVWNEEILAAIRLDLPHPPVHARNLFHLSAVMYDAWAAYDSVAVGYIYRGKHQTSDRESARRAAISYAAYRLLKERYTLSRNAAVTVAALDARMAALGLDKNNESTDPATPIGVGNRVAAAVSAFAITDGAQQSRGYQDWPPAQGGYASVNTPLQISPPAGVTADVNHWQPLTLTIAFTQNGLPIPGTQTFIGAQWHGVRPFALSREDPGLPWIDPGPPPRLGTSSDAAFRAAIVEVIRRGSELSVSDNVMVDISPGQLGNNGLGLDDGAGHAINPVTQQPYPPNRVARGDFSRVLAEYWADGPSSETPPGHWNTIANHVADQPGFLRRFKGAGPVLEALEWDVKTYFAMNGALHDAACAAWTLKRHYDGWRPVTAIRWMGNLGQSTQPDSPAYHSNGLPLVPGLIELVTAESAAANGRHAGLMPDTLAILAWPGPPANPLAEASGVRWIAAGHWLPYQRKTFVTPAFPGYISGHSTFSRAAAEVLAVITGSAFFPGGLGVFNVPARFLAFELGPSAPFQLQWATYFDAADQAGQSRVWGGIHPSADDYPGRRVGAQCGLGAWALAESYFDGLILRAPVTLSIRELESGRCEIRFPSYRGFKYFIQASAAPEGPFVNLSPQPVVAVDSPSIWADDAAELRRFFRVMRGE